MVNLTVTDDDGATGWITKNVAVIVTVITTCEELQIYIGGKEYDLENVTIGVKVASMLSEW